METLSFCIRSKSVKETLFNIVYVQAAQNTSGAFFRQPRGTGKKRMRKNRNLQDSFVETAGKGRKMIESWRVSFRNDGKLV